MSTFEDFTISKHLKNGLNDLGFESPTPIQEQAFSMVRSGQDMVGIAQTGTGKTMAYLLPILQDLPYANQKHPRVLIMVPTRELVLQVVQSVTDLAKYTNTRVKGVFGGVNINTQQLEVEEGCDVLVATPGRLYDLTIRRAIQLKSVQKLVIDEVDVMLDLGFRPQIVNIFELLPQRRQNIMFSATMTEDVEALIDDYFYNPKKIMIAVSGTPLDNISQSVYYVKNFNTKANLLKTLLADQDEYRKVLIFVSSKRHADRLFNNLEEDLGSEISVIHSNKTQNYRIRSIEEFDSGQHRILLSTDVMARGLDLDKITHVINFDVPIYPENYMHRIGRTGRAEQEGKSILLYTQTEEPAKLAIEELMDYQIPVYEIPEEVEISDELIPDERPVDVELVNHNRNKSFQASGASTHDKKDKNKKVNLGGSYHREIAKKYKKPKTRGDKGINRRKK